MVTSTVSLAPFFIVSINIVWTWGAPYRLPWGHSFSLNLRAWGFGFVIIGQVLPLDQLVGSRDKLIFFWRVIDPLSPSRYSWSAWPALEIDFAGFLQSQWSRGLGYLRWHWSAWWRWSPLPGWFFDVFSSGFPAPRGVPGLVLRLICMEKLLVMDPRLSDESFWVAPFIESPIKLKGPHEGEWWQKSKRLGPLRVI